jgi:cysteine desulfurase/selenocysteine lyase
MSLTPQDVARIRADFPILHEQVNGKPLVYLDNAATTQKPKQVIARLNQFYMQENSNVHRGLHALSQIATDCYEAARATTQRFINAGHPEEIIFVRGTTEAINLVAHSFGQQFRAGDEIIISAMEHHSNIVPWQILCQQTGAKLRVIPMNEAGELLFDQYLELLNERTRLVAVVHLSNALGTINPIAEMIAAAHAKNIPVLIDGAQAVSHLPVDVQALDCDFYTFSGHKCFGPTGIGVLYGKRALLDRMPPYQSGGDMIRSVTFEETEYNILPYKFEAGTPNIAGAIGLATALDYLQAIGLKNIQEYEHELLVRATEKLLTFPEVRLIGTAKNKASILSFVFDNIHAHDVGTILDQEGVAIRSGHHCAMPVMDFYHIPASARASFAFYNTFEEIDCLVSALHQVHEVFA